MPRRILDLRDEVPLLDIVSHGRAYKHTPTQLQEIKLTVGRIPEVMVRVSGGARTVAGVRMHVDYVGREGELGLETDTGERLDGKGFARRLTDDWDLDVDAHPRQTARAIRARKPPKLVHNVIFSMPAGVPAEKVLHAVRMLANNEWQLKHRYAMALHTDQGHPHVHVIIKAKSEHGVRLNIRKATLRSWRRHFAANLRQLGVAANATERAVRGQTRTHKTTGIYRADKREESSHMRARYEEAARQGEDTANKPDPGYLRMERTRRRVVAGWREVEAQLRRQGDRALADEIDRFLKDMPPVQTEQDRLAKLVRDRTTHAPDVDRDRTQ